MRGKKRNESVSRASSGDLLRRVFMSFTNKIKSQSRIIDINEYSYSEA